MNPQRKKNSRLKNAAPAPPAAGRTRPISPANPWATPAVCIFLALIILAVFGQTLGFQFVNFDDPRYVYENPHIAGGLNLNSVAWAFTHTHSDNWHPLTTISHMADCQVYGLNPWGHHLTSVLLHTAAAVLLFLVLKQMTGFRWRSALVAAVFAIHPLRVESVAWISERKDVLSGVFFMLTLWAYLGYVRKPSSRGRYGLVVMLYALGLMCKPSLVTLPFVLLLLDYWPLNRFASRAGAEGCWPLVWPRLREKIPLLCLAAASSGATMLAQKYAVAKFTEVSLASRTGNALVAYVTYVGQMFWPVNLAVLYPLRPRLPAVEIGAAVLLLAGVSIAVIVWRQKHPYLLVGWFWYVGMLVPMIGIIQVGEQAHADRYTYLPQIGLVMLLVWLAADWGARIVWRRWLLNGMAAVMVVTLAVCAGAQTAYWHDSFSLWNRTLEKTGPNSTAHYDLGNAFSRAGRIDEAISQYQQALDINSNFAEVHINLGNALLEENRMDEAMGQYQRALDILPDSTEALAGLGFTLMQKGRVDEAVVEYQKALALKPGLAEAENNLGDALLQRGSLDEAMEHFQAALKINPDYADANFSLGLVLQRKGRIAEAIRCYEHALQAKPNQVEALNNLANLLATAGDDKLRNGTRAVELARQADQITGDENPVVLGTLAAACAEAGQMAEAVANGRHALQLATGQGNPALISALQAQLKCYQMGIPFHDITRPQ